MNSFDDLEVEHFYRIPFAVKAVKITEDNIKEIASVIGTLIEKPNGSIIKVDRRIIPHSTHAKVGSWVTVVDNNYRVFSDEAFSKVFACLDASEDVNGLVHIAVDRDTLF
jgi:hypothetical protein